MLQVDGEVVWRSTYHPGDLRDLFSMTKTVVAVLAGIALGDGLVPSLDAEVEPGVSARHLLTMTRGAAAGADDIDRVQELATGWVRAVRAAPRADRPGSVFRYDNGAAHLLGAWLADRIGTSLEQLAAERLFAPLGIEHWVWPADPEGYSYGFGHLRLPVEAILGIGLLLLRGGRARDGRQVVPAWWVADMTTAWSPGGPPEHCPYGYFTWVEPGGFFAGGWAGQHLTVVPRWNAVVLTTGLPELLAPDWRPARPVVLAELERVASA